MKLMSLSLKMLLQKMFCQALRKRGGRMHQWMIDRMLAEPLPPAADFLYDQAVCSPVR